MRRLLAFFCFAAALNAQSVQQTFSKIGNGSNSNYTLTFYWTADSSGNVPVTAARIPTDVQGLRVLQTETIPGSPAPTNGYSIALTDANGGDLMTGAMASLSSSAVQFFSATAGTPPIVGTFSLAITGQGVANAKGTLVVYIGPTTLVSTTVGTQGPPGPPGAQGQAGPPGGGLNAAIYNFTPQTPGTTLTAGVGASITLTPCPLGVNGSDSNHWYYVSGGTGTAEPVLGAGGTCTSGATTGTLIFTPANNHSGAWTIQSATAGIREAVLVAAATGGGTVVIPPGTYTIRAAVVVPSKVRLIGSGRSNTTLAANSVTASPWWGATNTTATVIAASGVDSIEVASFTVNLGTPGTGLAAFSGVGLTNSYIHDLASVNPWQGGIMPVLNLASAVSSFNNVIEGNFLYNGSGCTDNNGPAGVNLNNSFYTRVANNYVEGGCASAYAASNGRDNVFVGNSFVLKSGTMSAGNQAYTADSASRISFIGNTCYGNGTGPACFTGAADSAVQDEPNDNVFSGNIAANCGYGFFISGGATASQGARRNIIDGNTASGCTFGVYVTSGTPYPGFIEGVTISNNNIVNSTTDGIRIYATVTGQPITGVVIKGNQISKSAVWGINILQSFAGLIKQVTIAENFLNHNGATGATGAVLINPAVGSPVSDGIITGNTFADTITPNVQNFNLLFNSADTYQRWTITGNNFEGTNSLVQWPNSGDITKMQSSYIAGNACVGTSCNGLPTGVTYASPATFGSLGTCGANNAGSTATVTDSNTNVWGATVAGAGANKILAFCNGASWTVAGK